MKHGRRDYLEAVGRARVRGLYFALGATMCATIKDFDVHAKGVARLVESWKERHAAVRALWRLEDLVGEWLRLFATAGEIFAYYCEHGQFFNAEATFSYFVDILEETVRCGGEVDDLVCMFETQGYSVDRTDELRRGITKLQDIVEEDRFATNAAFHGGALDEWD